MLCKSLRMRLRGFSNPPFRTRNSFRINYLEECFWFRTIIVQRFHPPQFIFIRWQMASCLSPVVKIPQKFDFEGVCYARRSE